MLSLAHQQLATMLRFQAPIPDSELAKLAAIFRPVRVAGGTILLHAGEAPRTLAFVVSGILCLYYIADDGAEAQEQFVAAEIQPILARAPGVRVAFYDAEAFTGRCSDVAVFEASSLDAYAGVIDALRDTKLYSGPYFEIIDIIPTKQANFV